MVLIGFKQMTYSNIVILKMISLDFNVIIIRMQDAVVMVQFLFISSFFFTFEQVSLSNKESKQFIQIKRIIFELVHFSILIDRSYTYVYISIQV
jgi:hypothetical protein